jgi:hypothetical protein
LKDRTGDPLRRFPDLWASILAGASSREALNDKGMIGV